jgi:hypothetical protein
MWHVECHFEARALQGLEVSACRPGWSQRFTYQQQLVSECSVWCSALYKGDLLAVRLRWQVCQVVES